VLTAHLLRAYFYTAIVPRSLDVSVSLHSFPRNINLRGASCFTN